MAYPGRTTVAAVQAIVDCDLSIDMTQFIDTANELVSEFCVIPSSLPANVAQADWNSGYMPGYTDVRLELIERWLSAHFYAIRDIQYINQSIGGASISSGMQMGKGFEATRYGQQAMMLDTAGGLAGLNARIVKGDRKRQIGVMHMGRSCRRNNYNQGDGPPIGRYIITGG